MLNVLACEEVTNSIGLVAIAPFMDSPPGMPICQTCGKAAAASARFCGACGTPLSDDIKAPAQSKGQNSWGWKWILLALVAVVSLLISAAKLDKHSHSHDAEMSERTRIFWASMRRVEEQANSVLKDKKLGRYPLTDSGQFDFRNFSPADFDSLERFHADKAKISQDVANKIAKLPILNVDPNLLDFKIELSEHWSTEADTDAEFVQLLLLLEQQKANFTSNEAYAVRTLAALAGQPQMEQKYRESQAQIDSQAVKWKEAQERADAIFKKVERREQEIQALLSQKYQSEFK